MFLVKSYENEGFWLLKSVPKKRLKLTLQTAFLGVSVWTIGIKTHQKTCLCGQVDTNRKRSRGRNPIFCFVRRDENVDI